MVADDRPDVVEGSQGSDQVGAHDGVGPHPRLLSRVEGPGLEQDVVGQGDLAEVVQETAQPERLECPLIDAEGSAQADRVRGETLAVPPRVGVPRLDGHAEHGEDVFGLLELVEQKLHPEKRPDPGAKLREVTGLPEEVIRSGGQPGHARIQVGPRGQEDHGDEPETGIGLQASTELHPAHRSHVDVGEDQVDPRAVENLERDFRRGRRHHPVALGFQMIRERGPHVGVVLDDEDGRRFRPGRHCLRHQDSPGIAALRACRTAWSTLSSANGLFTQGTPVSSRNRLAPGLSVSPVMKMTRRRRPGYRRSISR